MKIISNELYIVTGLFLVFFIALGILLQNNKVLWDEKIMGKNYTIDDDDDNIVGDDGNDDGNDDDNVDT